MGHRLHRPQSSQARTQADSVRGVAVGRCRGLNKAGGVTNQVTPHPIHHRAWPMSIRHDNLDGLLVRSATAHCAWSPNPGAQARAYGCEADELFYGGQAGGGKTDLGLGLALTAHKRSLILRRINKDAVKLVERVAQILGHRDGYNGQLQRWKLGDRLIEFAGCEHDDDKHRFKGDPHDLIYFDEGTDFLQSQYRFIIGWNRNTNPHQRCRVVVGSNPPTTSEGLWVIKHWAPWLDPLHPKPA